MSVDCFVWTIRTDGSILIKYGSGLSEKDKLRCQQALVKVLGMRKTYVRD